MLTRGLTILALACVAFGAKSAAAQVGAFEARYVAEEGGRGRFPLFAEGRAAALHVDSADWAGVIRAAGDLRDDVERVTGTAPALNVGGALSGEVVLIGTLGKSPTIDALVRAGKLDARGVAGKWESFVVQVVDRPLPNVPRALVIAGSDRRGTIYGIYDLSAQIGVSPWYWWADVPVTRMSAVHVLPGRHTRGEPAVRYRGIFINDEAPALSGWARRTFGGFNHRFYGKVFELVLRMRGNFVWPAMWGSAFYADDLMNAATADEYGVVIGTSHHEPMLRAHDEWRRFGDGPWDYTKNDSTLREFWREGARRLSLTESVVTLAMRGDGDEPMTQGTATALLERIVADQRRILAETTGRDVTTIPQVWALYKEVQDYYDAGMRVPDDVTLLFSDDNWGNLRRLPSAADRGRPGGFGVYYHFDYVGGPRNYKWINTTQIGRVWEQLDLARSHGADRLWIANVGDIKPMELPISFFLDYAWSPQRIPADSLPAWTRSWATRQFGGRAATEIAELLDAHTRHASQRKPELVDSLSFSLANYREGDIVAANHEVLDARAAALREQLPPAVLDAYDQLVFFPVRALANLHQLNHVVALNRLYARQGRAATNLMADSARRLFERDAALTRWYNDSIAGGKWAHMMDQTHIGYTYWQEPPRNQMPRVDVIQVPAAAEMGVALDGSGRWWPAERDSAVLAPFEEGQHAGRMIEVFNRGSTPFDLTVTIPVPWLTAMYTPRIATQQSIPLTIDWQNVPPGTHRVPITLTRAGRGVTVTAVVEKLPDA
ncbi:MAG TPA: glycosyl hydrolase 115 family protein, partial [Longimicrobium sp.]|nr:glycosyl hydrolase 115 family protein [Longimicrobium sp.]